jgi:hypothetical protein
MSYKQRGVSPNSSLGLADILSPAFRDLLALGTGSEGSVKVLAFADSAFEDAETLRLVLGFLTGTYDMPSAPTRPEYDSYDRCLYFAEKWECTVLRRVIVAQIMQRCQNAYNTGDCHLLSRAWKLGAKHDEMALCVQALLWSDGDSIMEPRDWNASFVKDIPLAFLWILRDIMDDPLRKDAKAVALAIDFEESRGTQFRFTILALHKTLIDTPTYS